MSFKDIRGQERPIEIIKECIKDSRQAKGWLFTGPEGIGKRLAAKTFAKALNCQQGLPEDSCDNCASCFKIENMQHPDIFFINNSESASIKIEDIRQMQKNLSLRPYEGRKKVYIIDNAHSFTPEASGAVLKILEEPPENSMIILISAKPALLFKTVLSRCRVLKFYPMKRLVLKSILINDYGVDCACAHFLAYFSEGRLGAALKFKDEGLFKQKNIIINELICNNKTGLNKSGFEDRESLRRALNIITVWFKDIYLIKAGHAEQELINIDRKDDLLKSSQAYSFAELDNLVNNISDSLLGIEQNLNVKLLLSNLRCSFNR
ncbi:MAG: AAA family ATPase [Candidatus Omnitrophota bacterium]